MTPRLSKPKRFGGAGRGDDQLSDPVARAPSLSGVEETARLYGERASTRHDDLGYRANVLADVASMAPLDDRLVILTGPRRVGMSVAMLDVTAALCGRADVDPAK